MLEYSFVLVIKEILMLLPDAEIYTLFADRMFFQLLALSQIEEESSQGLQVL